MFSFLTKRFWQLRKKRALVIKAVNDIRITHFPNVKLSSNETNYLNYFNVYGGCYGRCHLCNEDVYGISLIIESVSLAGEKFYNVRYPFAFLCARCETVATDSSISMSPTSVWNWIKNPAPLPQEVFFPRPVKKAEPDTVITKSNNQAKITTEANVRGVERK